jgi:hypothetical protein
VDGATVDRSVSADIGVDEAAGPAAGGTGAAAAGDDDSSPAPTARTDATSKVFRNDTRHHHPR